MTEETTGVEAPEADGVEPEAVASPESTPEQPATETAAEQPEADGTDEAAAPRKKPGVHNRIDELTRQKHDAIRDRDYWKQKATSLAATDIDTMEYDDQLVVKVQTATAKDRVDDAERTVQQAVAQQFGLLEDEARTKWADYDTVTRNQQLSITPDMAELIAESEIGPDIAYHLGKNPNEAVRLSQLPERQLAKEMGKLEARITAPKAVPKTPSAPVKPVSGIASSGSKDPDSMSFAEFKAWREANS